jgi:integrase
MTIRKNEARWVADREFWRIDVQVDGKRKVFYSSIKGRKGKIQCERNADEWLDRRSEEGKNPRLCELWDDYINEIRITTSDGNYRAIESRGRVHLVPPLKNRRIASITSQDWQDVITSAYQKGLAKKTCKNIRGDVTSLYTYARKNRISMERPEFLTVPRDAPEGERNILQPDQLKTLFSVDWITHWGDKKTCFTIHAWRFDVLSGLRRGELCGLQWDDLQCNILYVRRSISSTNQITKGKNKNAKRYMVLTGLMLDEIEQQRALLRRSGIISPWIFPAPDGSMIHPNNLYRRWYVYRSQHGINSSIHELRHTMISIVKADVPETLLKPIIGHSPKMDTGIYQHSVDGDADRAANMIDDVFHRILNG